MNITAIMGAVIIRSGKKEGPIEVLLCFCVWEFLSSVRVLTYEELHRQRWCGNHPGLQEGPPGASSLIFSPVSAPSHIPPKATLLSVFILSFFFNNSPANKQLIRCIADLLKYNEMIWKYGARSQVGASSRSWYPPSIHFCPRQRLSEPRRPGLDL